MPVIPPTGVQGARGAIEQHCIRHFRVYNNFWVPHFFFSICNYSIARLTLSFAEVFFALSLSLSLSLSVENKINSNLIPDMNQESQIKWKNPDLKGGFWLLFARKVSKFKDILQFDLNSSNKLMKGNFNSVNSLPPLGKNTFWITLF